MYGISVCRPHCDVAFDHTAAVVLMKCRLKTLGVGFSILTDRTAERADFSRASAGHMHDAVGGPEVPAATPLSFGGPLNRADN